MNCGHQCYEIGGPWIAEDPNCPVHGYEAQAEERRRDSLKSDIRTQINNAETVEELRACLLEMLDNL